MRRRPLAACLAASILWVAPARAEIITISYSGLDVADFAVPTPVKIIESYTLPTIPGAAVLANIYVTIAGALNFSDTGFVANVPAVPGDTVFLGRTPLLYQATPTRSDPLEFDQKSWDFLFYKVIGGADQYGDFVGTASFSNDEIVEIADFYGGDTTPDNEEFFYYYDDLTFDVSSISVASAVPEPSTWAMMLIGFAAVGAAVRLRAKRSSSAAA